MTKTYRIVTENLTTLSAQDYFRVQNFATKTTVTDLDEAQLWLGKVFPVTDGWFIYRGGNHVALHRVSGGVRVLIVEERVTHAPVEERLAANKAIVATVEAAAREIEAGDALDVWSNQALREGTVLAVVGDEYLVEYSMPNGSTSLLVFNRATPLETFKGKSFPAPSQGKSASYRSLSRKWLLAIIEAGQGWIAQPQGTRTASQRLPQPAEFLAQRDAKQSSRRAAPVTGTKVRW